jgi:dipeptidyl aminopeptidase/acylaminoacyl peptidase
VAVEEHLRWTKAVFRSFRYASLACAPLIAVVLIALAPRLVHAVPLEVYGHLPSLEDVALSPSGSRIAFVHTDGDARLIVVASLTDHKAVGALRVGDEKLREIDWADDDHLMILTSVTALSESVGLIGAKHEWTGLQVYDLRQHTTRILPEQVRDHSINMLNVIAGRVMVRRVKGHTVLFIPGVYLSQMSLPVLIRYDLDNDGERVVREGARDTQGWLVDSDGEVAAEEDYEESGQRWSIKIRRGRGLEEVASGHSGVEFPDLLGFGPRPDTLLVQSLENGDPVWRLMSMKDGSMSEPMAERRELDEPIEDPLTHRLVGGVHEDDGAEYLFFDPAIEDRWQSIVDAFAGEHVRFVSADEGFSKVVVLVEGVRHGYRYVLVDLGTHKVASIGNVYDGIEAPLEVRPLDYAAADGLHIHAYLTLPRGRPAKSLPLIVLPHGGPAIRDNAEFDWWSQALAEQGYAVLRPNYRGSTVSRAFLEAGFGEWGRKMQTDLSDGVRYLVKEGIADPARVCIVGGSYGGYAALAGVTLDPTVYRCAVSVAGLSDLARMLRWEEENRGLGDRRAIRYWDRFWGVSGASDPVLDAISPIKHVDAVRAPVLLIHGRDDTVVPYEQSQMMFDALHRAHKDVELVTLKHEDHWLSRSETRLQMLQATVAFLRAHDPPD